MFYPFVFLAELPSFIDAPQAVVKVAEGQNVTLTCQVFGAPKPVITWKKTDIGSTAPSKPVIGDRFILENSGNLRILVLSLEILPYQYLRCILISQCVAHRIE